MMAVLICAALGALIFMLVGVMLAPAAASPRTIRMRVAVVDDMVLIGVADGDRVSFVRIDR
jgi:hypothetical protein